MKVSLNTIKQYTQVDLPVDELVHMINQQLGGVEEVIDLGAKYKDAVIVRVVSVEKHGDADKLSVCQIDPGNDSEYSKFYLPDSNLVQVVCGALNVHTDMFAVWLPPKSTVPATYDDKEPFVLDTREIRGIDSNGMLAAPDELAIGSEHDGILEIHPDEWRPYSVEIKAGTSFAEAYGLNDTIIDIENKMFTHRPDCFGQLGVAREIAGIQGKAFVSPDWYLDQPQFKQADGLDLEVTNEAGEKVPRFMAVALKDVEIKPSPIWLQCALVALGSKPINNVVDATNYVMLLTAQPTHAYDYDKLRGHKLGARLAHEGEKIHLLNDKTYELTTEDIVIVDGEGPVGLGGVMGGGDSEVSPETHNIVLEVATFDMYAIRKTSMRHGLFTDAVTRFNKGQSPLQNPAVLNLLMQSIFDTAGGQQASPVEDKKLAKSDNPTHTFVHFLQINRLLGVELSDEEISRLLENVEFANVGLFGDLYDLKIPFWRTDIAWGTRDKTDSMNSVANADIAEEVGRLNGFDKLPHELPLRTMRPAPRNQSIELKQTIRRVLSSAGANEVLTYSFVHENVLTRAAQDPTQSFKLSNALSPDLQYYRQTLIPSLLAHVHSNIKAGHESFALFEIGKGHTKDELDDEDLPKEFGCIASVVTDRKASGAAFYRAKRLLEELLASLGLADDVTYSDFVLNDMTRKSAYFAPDRAAIVMIGNEPIGRVGEFTPSVQHAFKLPAYSAGFELGLAKLQNLRRSASYMPLSRFPYVTQDISLKVPADTSFSDVYSTASNALKATQPAETTARLIPLGVYQPEDGVSKTITLRLRVASYERTLTDTEVTTFLDAITAAAAGKHQASRV